MSEREVAQHLRSPAPRACGPTSPWWRRDLERNTLAAAASSRQRERECDVTYRVISADNHLLEPPNLSVDRVPARYKEHAPRMVRGKDGGDGWSLDGSIPDSTISLGGGLGSVNPGERIRIQPRGLRWDEVRPGNYDGAE